MAPPGPIPNPEVKHRHVDGSRTIGPARVDSCQDSTTPVGESQQGLTVFRGGPDRPPPMSMVDSAPPFVSRERRAGDGGVWCVLAHEAAGPTARWCALPPRRSRCAHPPGGGAARPYPRTPYPRQAELAGFCALPRACCAPRRVFLCWRMQRPACVRAGGALPPHRSPCSRSPGARGYAPLPPDPYPRQAELAGFCALRARAALRAGCFVLAHGATHPCARCGGALPPRRSLCSQPPG